MLILYERYLFRSGANLFVINERVFISNMTFSVFFLDHDGRGIRMKRRAFIAAAGAAAASGATAGAQVVPVQPIQGPQGQFLQQLTIGVNVTLSGPLQKYGQEVVKGVQAAVDEHEPLHTRRSRSCGACARSTIATTPASPPPTRTSRPPTPA